VVVDAIRQVVEAARKKRALDVRRPRGKLAPEAAGWEAGFNAAERPITMRDAVEISG
jgi:hypothetical protein